MHLLYFQQELTLGGYVNNQLRLAAASYSGEYVPGYCVNGTLQTNSNFKLYKVTRGDNFINNPDWLNWGLMVPYGAPFIDVNHDGIYEPAIDTPGVKDADQTIFLCMSDADPTSHHSDEGFSGGTVPLGAEVHLTAWCYSSAGYEDMQFLKWVVINRNTSSWDSTYFSIVCDPDLGYPNDDYIGCDTTKNLGFCYNSSDFDPVYGAHPPAVGIAFLNCRQPGFKFSSFDFFTNPTGSGPNCESDPLHPFESYNYMKGLKKDGTPWLNVHSHLRTKFCFAFPGWNEGDGEIRNCGGDTTGFAEGSPPGDKRFIMNSRLSNQTMNPGDTQVVEIAQMIARGADNLNSITKLLASVEMARQLCEAGFIIGINPVSSIVPDKFSLFQNYPNPFNPATKIKFDIAKQSNAKIIIYDAVGREITVVLNEQLRAGTYSIDWNANNYPSGVYFYKLQTESYSETKKMMLIK